MPVKPADRWQLLLFVRREYRAELPQRLHVVYVPNATASVENLGDVLDVGEMGSPSWSPMFHRRVGAVTHLFGEDGLEEAELAPFPWYRQLQGVRRWCARRHSHGEACWPITRAAVEGPLPLRIRASELDLLWGALDKLWSWVSAELNEIPRVRQGVARVVHNGAHTTGRHVGQPLTARADTAAAPTP